MDDDRQEAESLKYHSCAQVLALRSGNYALFGAFAGDSLPLLVLGTWEELRAHVDEYRVLADKTLAESRKPTVAAVAISVYDDLFGDQA